MYAYLGGSEAGNRTPRTGQPRNHLLSLTHSLTKLPTQITHSFAKMASRLMISTDLLGKMGVPNRSSNEAHFDDSSIMQDLNEAILTRIDVYYRNVVHALTVSCLLFFAIDTG